ncbi:MAG: lysylphosphatidylglycerol synthase transmembrane domain-containing protein [Thermodesulfobacteriota bacterium]|nr:lysylphosphatidylglycerol synthase transmembrane domain-containing protein [Thermodesulfobacteriota bacterium]
MGILSSGLFLYLAFRNVNLILAFAVFKKVKYFYLILILFLTVLSYYFRAVRWYYLMRPLKSIRISSLFSATMIGFMANNILPARLGEVFRAYIIGRKENVKKAASFATIILERIFDATILSFFLLFTLFFFTPPEWVKKGSYIFICIYFISLTYIIALVFKTESTFSFSLFFIKLFPKKLKNRLTELLNSFTLGLGILKSINHLGIVFILSFIIWLFCILIIQVLFFSFSLHLPFYAAFVLLVFVSMGITLPSSPGFIGTFQYFCIITLTLFPDVSKEAALSYSILFHASQYVPVTLIGLYCLWKEQLTFLELERQSQD